MRADKFLKIPIAYIMIEMGGIVLQCQIESLPS